MRFFRDIEAESFAASPQGSMLATGDDKDTIVLWDARTLTRLGSLKGRESKNDLKIDAVGFSADEKVVVGVSRDGLVRMWDPAVGTIVRTLQLPLEDPRSSLGNVALSPDAKMLAAGFEYGSAGVFDLSITPADGAAAGWLDGEGKFHAPTVPTMRTFRGHQDRVKRVAFSADGAMLATASDDKTAKVWNVTTGALLHTFSGHTREVYCVAFAPDGGTLASGSHDQTVRIWDLQTGSHVRTLKGHTGPVWCVGYAPDGKTLASSGSELRLWDPVTGLELRVIHSMRNARSLAFFSNGTMLASNDYSFFVDNVSSVTQRAGHVRPSFTGRWNIQSGPLELKVDAGSVRGTYPFFDGEVKGRLSSDGLTVEGTWSQSNGYSGGFVLKLSSDGKQVDGQRWVGERGTDTKLFGWSGDRME